MGCCGGGKSIKINTTKKASITPKKIRPVMPASTTKIVTPAQQQIKAKQVITKATVTVAATTVQKAKQRAAEMKTCPSCGASVRSMMAGSGPKRRWVCGSCGRQFA